MKSIVIAAALGLFLICCKKETGPKEMLLAEVIDDGLIEYRFKYNANNTITRLELYKNDPIDNSMSGYYAFVYDGSGKMTQLTVYKVPGDIASVKAVLKYDSTGMMIGGSTYDLSGPTPDVASFNTTYSYNAKGLVNKIQQKDKNGKLISYINLIYYDDSHLKTQENFEESGGMLWMRSKTSYSIPNGYYPTGLEKLRTLLSPDFMASMYSESIQVYEYDQNGFVTYNRKDVMSGREFNDDGSLGRQVLTRTFIKPEKPDAVSIKEFNYIKQ